MEESLIEELQSQRTKYKDYISYLGDIASEFHGYLSNPKLHNNPIILSLPDHPTIKPIPETTKPVPPVFTAGQYSKEDVTKLLGRVTVPDTKPESRKIKPMETASTQYNTHNYTLYLMGFLLLVFLLISGLDIDNHTWKQNDEKSGVKLMLSLSSSVTKVRKYIVPDVDSVLHISLGKSGRLWVSGDKDNLFQIDPEGNRRKQIQSSVGFGYHTVTQDGDLIYTDEKNNVITRITQDETITELIKTGDWNPTCIHASHINGDILVGMVKDEAAKVTRYSKTGKEIQNIQRNNNGQGLYSHPYYITENINGDICISDFNKRAVVVVNKSGQHRFSYTGQNPKFHPFGICTDLLGHILVSDGKTVHLLDQDGQFLSLLLTPKSLIKNPIGLCVDDENNLHVGHWNTNTVTVYKYLQ
uniref:Tripartite motif-containing protein 2 n=1 Tax=Magallana gigas TaxID=29159 RepID=K1Q666_MAGGI